MMEYLEGEEPSVDEMKAVLRKATCECTAVPVCAVLHTEIRVFRNFWTQLLSTCRLQPIYPAIKGVDPETVTRLRDILR